MKISIVTAVYNRASLIAEALGSVAGQSYRDIEHVIVDGASTDGTLQVIEKHGVHVAKLISEPDQGIYDALNKGIRAATGDVIGLLHSDDVFADDKVIADVASRFEDSTVNVVFGDLDYVAKADVQRPIRHWVAGEFNPARLRRGWMPPHPTVFVRAELYHALGVFNTKYVIAADYDMMLRLFGSGRVNAAYIQRVLVKMRVGGESNRSVGRVLRKSREDFGALRANGFTVREASAALMLKNLSKVSQFVIPRS